MKECASCGVLEIFADLKRIPPTFLLSHPMDNHSSPPRWVCIDERGCVRRSRMKMKSGRGITWGYESCSHVLIHCKACGSEQTAQGIRELWVEGDPFPDFTYVCSSCGAEYLRSKFVDISTVKKPICEKNAQNVPNHCWWESEEHEVCFDCCRCRRLRLPGIDPKQNLRRLFR